MMSFYLSGGVEVLGFISPTEPTDEYPVIDPLYGIDGFRNVNTLSDLNSIPNLRRRPGMVVGVSGGTQYYKLNPSPWNGTITDWSTFNSGSGGGTFTGGTVTGDTIFTQGLTATTFSAATYLGLPLDVYVTGGTYSNGTITFTNNSGGTFNVVGLNTGTTINLSGGTGISVSGTSPNFIVGNTLPDQIVNLSGGTNIKITGTYPNFGVEFTGTTSGSFTGGTVTGNTIFTQGVTATTFSASTYLGLPLDVYTTGFTFNPSTYDISIERNDGVTLTQNLGILATDVTITGGTYDPLNGSITFVNNTGGTFTVSGFITGFTDIQVTGYTYQDNTFTISDTSGNTFSATIDVMTGLTVNGLLSATTLNVNGVSITGDTYTTGGTYSNGTLDFYNNNGGSYQVTGLYTGQTSYVNSLTTGVGLSGDSTTGNITIINTLPDQVVTISGGTGILTGGTYPNFTIENTLPDQVVSISGGTNVDVTGTYPNFNITLTGLSDNNIYTTGFTYSANTFYIIDTSGNTFSATIDVMTGLTINGDLTVTGTTSLQGFSATTISATTIGTSGDCVDDIYVSNIHSCSPLNINPFDEGNVYFGSTSGVTFDLINNKVGIGTSTPSTIFKVVGNYTGGTDALIPQMLFQNSNTIPNTNKTAIIRTTVGTGYVVGGYPEIWLESQETSTGVGLTKLRTVSNHPLLFYTNDIERARFGETGNFGINTQSPAGKLHVRTTTNQNIIFTSGTTGNQIRSLVDGNAAYTGLDLDSLNLNLKTNGLDRVVVDSSGNVGIGTSSPSEKLDVNGKTKTINLQVTSGATAGYVLTALDNSGNTQWVALGSNNNELDPVLTIIGTTASTVNIGDRFLISGGTGIWSGRTNQIAEYTGVTPTGYSYYIPVIDDVVFVTDTLTTYRFDGTNWISWRGTAILQNGNSLTTSVNIGSNNNQNLTFRTSGQTRVTISASTGNVGIGTTTPQARLHVAGTNLMSAATQNVLTIVGSGNTNSSPIFSVQGSSGELFSVSDSLVGSLFSVNDISGLPVIEAFSNNTILMGSYLAPSLNTTARVIATTGTTNVYSIPTSAYTGAFFDYTVSDGTNLRAGNIMSIWSGTSVNITETQTTDFGNTSGLTFNMVVSSGNAILRTSGATGNWTVKTIVRSI